MTETQWKFKTKCAMNGNSILIDTNFVLYLLNGNEYILNQIQGKEVFNSVITEIELLSYSKITESETSEISNLLSSLTIIEINEKVKQNTIYLRKKHNTKTPDSIILGTTKYLNTPLFTADKRLKKIETEVNIILHDI